MVENTHYTGLTQVFGFNQFQLHPIVRQEQNALLQTFRNYAYLYDNDVLKLEADFHNEFNVICKYTPSQSITDAQLMCIRHTSGRLQTIISKYKPPSVADTRPIIEHPSESTSSKCTVGVNKLKHERKKPYSRSTLPTKALNLMQTWYDQNSHYPYPTAEEKQRFAIEGGITAKQVKSWFCNKRNRMHNTLGKNRGLKSQRSHSYEVPSPDSGCCELSQGSLHSFGIQEDSTSSFNDNSTTKSESTIDFSGLLDGYVEKKEGNS